MKHFIVEITYIAPLESIEKVVSNHRIFLQAGYDAGKLLMSGPQEPKVGGIIIVRGETKEEVVSFFSKDPYNLSELVEYRFIEFNPVKFQSFLADWCS